MPKIIPDAEKRRQQVQIAFDKTMLSWIKQEAEEKDVSAAQIVRWAVRAQMKTTQAAAIAEVQPA